MPLPWRLFSGIGDGLQPFFPPRQRRLFLPGIIVPVVDGDDASGLVTQDGINDLV